MLPPASHSLNTISAQAVETAKAARAHAMDVRVNKKKANPLLTTAGLNHARASGNIPATIDKIQVHMEVRVRDGTKRTSQSTDPNFGKWGLLWDREAYLSGMSSEPA